MSFYVVFKMDNSKLCSMIANGNHQAQLLVVHACKYGKIVEINSNITSYMIRCKELFKHSYTAPNYCNYSFDRIMDALVDVEVYSDSDDIQW